MIRVKGGRVEGKSERAEGKWRKYEKERPNVLRAPGLFTISTRKTPKSGIPRLNGSDSALHTH